MKRLLIFLIACSATPAQQGDAFVAFGASFNQFHSWSNAPSEPPPNSPVSLHGTGPWQAYINKRPPPMSTTFPVGTIIVKETQEADPTLRTVFAMVKRGGGYNATGAAGWEWFELLNVVDGSATIKWRGVGPPSGEMYGGDPNGCNGCHAGAKGNDYVWSAAFALSSF